MKIKISAMAVVIFLAIPSLGYCEIDGPIAREALKRETLTLLSSSQFEKLEEVAKIYSAKKERSPDGNWKLYSLFNAFQNPPCKTDADWNKHLSLLDKWQAVYPASDCAKTALAAAWMGYAWFARGTDYEIKADGYSHMKERLGKAEKLLMNVSDSYVPSLDLKLQLALANSTPRNKFDAMFKKAVSVEPSYVAFYAAAINYYLPRWYGEPGEWAKKLEEFDLLAPRKEGIYARVAFGQLGNEWNGFSEGTIKWEKMKKSLNDIHFDSPWIDNMSASYACLAEDYDMARTLLKKIGTGVYNPAWKHVSLLDCMKKAGLPGDSAGLEKSLDYQYMEELSKNNNPWATELLNKWKKYNMVGFTY